MFRPSPAAGRTGLSAVATIINNIRVRSQAPLDLALSQRLRTLGLVFRSQPLTFVKSNLAIVDKFYKELYKEPGMFICGDALRVTYQITFLVEFESRINDTQLLQQLSYLSEH